MKTTNTKIVFDSQQLDYSCELMRALAHPLRLQILEFLDSSSEIGVNHIYNSLNIEQSITSQHLKVMRMAGILNVEKEGKFMQYTINYEVIERAKLAVKKFLHS